MIKMKKFVKILLTLFTALLFLGGCSQQAQEALAEYDRKHSDQASGDRVEIEFWYGLGSIAGQTMEEIIEDFNNSQGQVRVIGVAQANYDETYQKLQAAIAADIAPAVVLSDDIVEQSESQILKPLNDFMDDTMDPDDFLPVFMDLAISDGQVYGFPAFGTTQVMYYRKDILAEAGIDPDETYASWENVMAYSKQLQEDGYVENGHQLMWGTDNLIDIAYSSGGQIISDDGTQVLIDQAPWVDSWNFIRENIHDGTSPIESGGQGWEYWYRTIDNVMTGKSIGYTGSSGDKADLDFDIIGSAEQPGYNGHEPRPMSEGLYLAIPDQVSDQEAKAAFEWIKYFTSPQVQADWTKAVGYVPVRIDETMNQVPGFSEFLAENPAYKTPMDQSTHASYSFTDPTGGKIYQALSDARDKVELQNIPAEEALAEAQEIAQKALDQVNARED
ncbi:ABC transporter substrate-binding protein [Aerococcus tenax]|nr:ABC transporter substrate-binding protein [Aerococcus urinae]RAW04965.1 ABC transporter substrate-binding protein [Aerococcus urinae]